MIPISAYKFHVTPEGVTVPGAIPFATDLETELHRFRDGYYKDAVLKTRTITDKKERSLFKAQNLSSITVSCTTDKWRNIQNVTCHSGFICFDIDAGDNPQIDDWAKLRDDLAASPRIAAAFLSASGVGLAFICRIIPSQHLDVFLSVEYDMYREYGVKLDPSGKDVVRLRFITYDPELKMKPNILDTELLLPSEAYLSHKKAAASFVARPASSADSYAAFTYAIDFAGRKREFQEGERHWYLVRLAMYANKIGMSREYCGQMVLKYFSDKTDLTPESLLKPIKNVYRTYVAQHGTMPLPKPLYRTKDLRWLLKRVDKSLIRKHLHLYGTKTIIGSDTYTIGVSSDLLCFLMHLACPQYTWTTTEINDEFYTNAQCAEVFPKDHYLDHCNDSRVFCHIDQKYPSTWNA